MEPEPQYPVDAITTEAMKASEPVGMDMSLDDIVKQHRVANKKRGDGKLSRDERLKVKAGVNKGGPGRTTSGGRGAASKKREKVNRHRPTYIKRDDGVTVVQIFNKDVVQVNREGEVLLDTGGDRGVGVLRAVNEALTKFGFKVTAARDDAETWTVSDGVRYFKRYEDGLVIPKPHPPGPGRALALMQADPPHFHRAGRGRGFGGRGRGFGSRGRGRGRGFY